MALSFPPNLDDGELWLPKEIIPDVVGGAHHHHGVSRRRRQDHVEALANQLAALGLLGSAAAWRAHRNQPADHPLFHEGFRMVTELEAAAVNGFRVPACRASAGTGAFLPGPVSGSRTVTAQVVEGRGRILPRQQALARFRPGRVNGSSRESGGTGVFLPRVNYYDANAKKKLKEVTVVGGLQQQKQLLQQQQQQQGWICAVGAGGGGKQQKVMMASPVQCQPPPELTLPQDWTY